MHFKVKDSPAKDSNAHGKREMDSSGSGRKLFAKESER